MARLILDPNLADPDAAYAALIAAHEGLSETGSAALNARLILILANHLGDAETLAEAIRVARDAARPADRAPAPRV